MTAIAAACVAAALPAAARPSKKDPPDALVIAVAAAHVGDGRVHAPAEILVVDGKVKEVGERVKAPEGARRWDRSTLTATPGLVEPSAFVRAARQGAAGAGTALLLAADERSPFDPWLAVVRGDGVVAACLVPDGGGPIHGRASTIGTTGPGAAGAPVLEREAALVASLATDSEGSAARAAAREGLPRALEAAEEYGRKRSEWKRENPAPKETSRSQRSALGRRTGGRPLRPKSPEPRESQEMEVLLKVLEKKLPLRVEAPRREDVIAALELARQRGLSLTLTGCVECAEVAEQLAASRALVLVEPLVASDREGPHGEPDPDMVLHLALAGARVAVSAGGPWPEGPSWLRVAAASLAGQGLPAAAAVSAMTGEAAKAAGIGRTHGFLAPGRDAEMLLWTGDPLEPSSTIEQHVLPSDTRRGKGSGEPEAAASDEGAGATDAGGAP